MRPLGEAALLDAGAIKQQGTLLPQTTFVYPQTVIDAKNELDPAFATTRADIAACAALSPAQKASFEALYLAWRKLFCRNDSGQCAKPDYSWFGLGSQLDEVESFQQRLFDWQETLKGAACAQSQPEIAPPGAPIETGALKWIVVLAGLGAALYVAHETGVLRRLRSKR